MKKTVISKIEIFVNERKLEFIKIKSSKTRCLDVIMLCYDAHLLK